MILANLLDNAIRASEECEEEHTIYFTMRLIDGTLSLDIQNTYQGPVTIVDNELRTTKRKMTGMDMASKCTACCSKLWRNISAVLGKKIVRNTYYDSSKDMISMYENDSLKD